MATRLRRCRDWWGECGLREDRPALREVADALYLPHSFDGPWGVFGPDGRIGPDGVDGPLPDPAGVPAAPEAEYLYLGHLVPHYGHFIIDSLSRLWPLAAREGRPLRLLIHTFDPLPAFGALDFLRSILGRLGLSPEDLVAFDRPTRLTRLIVPAPSFLAQVEAHIVFADLCRRIGAGFYDPAEADADERPLYLSKSRLATGIARIANEDDLVGELDRRGVEIAYPERLAFGEQVRLLSRRRLILGSTGSAFHTTIFAAPGRRLIGLNWMPAVNANFGLVDRLAGNAARYYHLAGTRYAPAEGFEFRWTIPDPRAVAAELVARAEAFDDLDARDAADRPAHARGLRSYAGALRGRISRRVRAAAGRWRGA
ncbi:MAG: glycosyltransferase family 61 protein [Methylobacterium frigidaeris]